MPDGLYERDILLWAETQSDLLRRLAAGERVNEAVDWPNLIEEVEDVGKSELNACQSLIQQALIHLLKLRAWPQSTAAGHWRSEVVAFLANAERRFSPSMRRAIDLSRLYQRAVLAARLETDESGQPADLPDACPFTLDQLLADDVTTLWSEG